MATAEGRLSLDEMREALAQPVRDALGCGEGDLRIEYLIDPKEVADDPAKLAILDTRGRKQAVVLVSAAIEPDLVARGMRAADQARAALGMGLRDVILEPLAEGRLEGRSYTILPYCPPISDARIARWLTRRFLRGKVLDWLADAVGATVSEPDGEQRRRAFEEPLSHLSTSGARRGERSGGGW